jgi:hypothetical protein
LQRDRRHSTHSAAPPAVTSLGAATRGVGVIVCWPSPAGVQHAESLPQPGVLTVLPPHSVRGPLVPPSACAAWCCCSAVGPARPPSQCDAPTASI